MYNHIFHPGHKIVEKEKWEGGMFMGIKDGEIKYDIEKGQFVVYNNGEWTVLKPLLDDKKIFTRSMSKIVVPDSDYSGNIGYRNETNGFSSTAIGKMSRTNYRGQESFASGGFLEPGDAQVTRFIIKTECKPDILTEILIDDVERIRAQPKKSYYISVKFFIIGKEDGTKKCQRIVLNYKCILSYNTLKELICETIFNEPEKLPSKWELSCYTEDDCLTFYCKSPIKSRWVGLVKTMEVSM